MVGAWLLVRRLQQAPEPRLHADDREQIAGGADALNAFGGGFVTEVGAVWKEPGNASERPRSVAIIDEVGDVERRAIAADLLHNEHGSPPPSHSQRPIVLPSANFAPMNAPAAVPSFIGLKRTVTSSPALNVVLRQP